MIARLLSSFFVLSISEMTCLDNGNVEVKYNLHPTGNTRHNVKVLQHLIFLLQLKYWKYIASVLMVIGYLLSWTHKTIVQFLVYSQLLNLALHAVYMFPKTSTCHTFTASLSQLAILQVVVIATDQISALHPSGHRIQLSNGPLVDRNHHKVVDRFALQEIGTPDIQRIEPKFCRRIVTGGVSSVSDAIL